MSEETTPALPYLKLLENRDPLAVLAESPAKLEAMLEGLSEEQTERKPAPEKWNLREIVAHIADMEIVWSWRYRLIYSAENPHLEPMQQDRWASIYKSYTTAQALETWRTLRAWNVAFLKTLTKEERDRNGQHPELGAVTLWTLASIAAGHDLHHLRSLEHVAHGLKN